MLSGPPNCRRRCGAPRMSIQRMQSVSGVPAFRRPAPCLRPGCCSRRRRPRRPDRRGGRAAAASRRPRPATSRPAAAPRRRPAARCSSTGSNSQPATRPSIAISATLAPDVPRSTARMYLFRESTGRPRPSPARDHGDRATPVASWPQHSTGPPLYDGRRKGDTRRHRKASSQGAPDDPGKRDDRPAERPRFDARLRAGAAHRRGDADDPSCRHAGADGRQPDALLDHRDRRPGDKGPACRHLRRPAVHRARALGAGVRRRLPEMDGSVRRVPASNASWAVRTTSRRSSPISCWPAPTR